jgi:1,2-phenylacetyl-CoA epoxidase catalytic subunit
MADRVKSIKELFNSNDDYADILDMFDEENMFDEDIARDAKIGIDTVKSIKKSWIDKDSSYLQSIFSINKRPLKKSRH